MEESDVESGDSDRELQVAFASGLIEPGLNVQQNVREKPTFINNVEGLEESLKNLKNDLPWIERLDVTVGPAPAPKPMAHQLGENPDELLGDDVHNDFKREMRFYRLAQAAVFEAIPRFNSMNIPTKRPTDYFAEMAKSDIHMKKVREKLLSKQNAMERSEKAKKMRDLRKYGKKVQQEVLQKRQKEKKQMMDAVKKYRKGQSDKIEFLEESKQERTKGNKGQQQTPKKNQFQSNKKRQLKNQKYGFGGQKKRAKYNTAESARDMSDYSKKKHGTVPIKFKKAQQGSKNRPGKQRRQKQKGNTNRRKT